MFNVTPQTWIEEGEELGKEMSRVHVGLNVTESEEGREDSGRDLVPEHQRD